MKKIIVILIAVLSGLQLFAQQDEIGFGAARADAIYMVTKGAFWSSRPEAKEVYQKGYSTVAGVTVYRLKKDYLGRFVKGENNRLDINYIIIPAGSLVYEKDGKYHLAMCGNEFEYLQPKEPEAKIIERIVEVPVPAPPQCINKLLLIINRFVDINGKQILPDEVDTVGVIQIGCFNDFKWKINVFVDKPVEQEKELVDLPSGTKRGRGFSDDCSCRSSEKIFVVNQKPQQSGFTRFVNGVTRFFSLNVSYNGGGTSYPQNFNHASGTGGFTDYGNHASGTRGFTDNNNHAGGTGGNGNGSNNSGGTRGWTN